MAGLKPIIHGNVDPTEIPSYCRMCQYYNSNGTDYPKCERREDGKFRPEIGFSCYRSRSGGIKNGA